MTDKNALLKDVKKGAQLEHRDPPKDASLAQAQTLMAVKSGKVELNEVAQPKAGVSDAVKKAFVEDQKEKGKK